MNTIDQKGLMTLLDANAVGQVKIVAQGRAWHVLVRSTLQEKVLVTSRKEVRKWRNLESLVKYLHEIGIAEFYVNSIDYDENDISRNKRPDMTARLKKVWE